MTLTLAGAEWLTNSPYAALYLLSLLPLLAAAIAMHEQDEERRHKWVAFFLSSFIALLLFIWVMSALDIELRDLLKRKRLFTHRYSRTRLILCLMLWAATAKLISLGILRLFYRLRRRRAEEDKEKDEE